MYDVCSILTLVVQHDIQNQVIRRRYWTERTGSNEARSQPRDLRGRYQPYVQSPISSSTMSYQNYTLRSAGDSHQSFRQLVRGFLSPKRSSILLLKENMLEAVESSRDASGLNLREGFCLEAVGIVEGDDVAGLAAAHDARSRHAGNVHDTRNSRAISTPCRGATEGNHTAAAFEIAFRSRPQSRVAEM